MKNIIRGHNISKFHLRISITRWVEFYFKTQYLQKYKNGVNTQFLCKFNVESVPASILLKTVFFPHQNEFEFCNLHQNAVSPVKFASKRDNSRRCPKNHRKYFFWNETSLGWFGGEWNGNVALTIMFTQRSLPESNGTISIIKSIRSMSHY